VSNPNDATLNGHFDNLVGASEQGGIWAAIHKALQAPHSAEKALVLKDLAQALKDVAPEAQATEGTLVPKKTVSVETLSARISTLMWFIGVFAGLIVAGFTGFFAFSQSNMGHLDARMSSLDARMGSLEAKVETRMGNLEAKVETRMGSLDARVGSLDARMDKFYGILMDLQKDVSKMQASQDKMQATLDEVKASLNR
jgi:uncharacterized coiled-coil protein SlyX